MSDSNVVITLGKTILVHVELPHAESQEDLKEMQSLVETAGGQILHSEICKREAPDPHTFIGSGKVLEIDSLVKAEDAQTIVFNSRLSPAQERNLEQVFGQRVMDRVALILLIFAQRARSYEGKLQVELAQLQYEQARLVRGWTHLERQKGGFGLRGGPGETQIELDRRLLHQRILEIKKNLETVAKRRAQNRNLRQRNAVPLISCVGYTNAGKSTLFNKLTSADVYMANQLFATLDTTIRTLTLPVVGQVVFADTVGFIRHLPHDLIAAFRATLEETALSTLLLHVVDAADPKLEENIRAVEEVLAQIGASHVPTLLVYNKSDLLPECPARIIRDEAGRPLRVYVSAKTGEGLESLLDAIGELVGENVLELDLNISSTQGKLRALLHNLGAVVSETFGDQGEVKLKLKIKATDAAIIDSKTAGELAKAVGLDRLPWQNNNEFDFNSID
ncbi:MAG: GTPase HflX [Succinivibrio sp.]|nr:GTPase HflX [Succinivibrio sp.]